MTRSAARRANRNAWRLMFALSWELIERALYRDGSFDGDSARRFARVEEPTLCAWMRDINWPLVAERMNRDGLRSVPERRTR